jgi:hypothetical protein
VVDARGASLRIVGGAQRVTIDRDRYTRVLPTASWTKEPSPAGMDSRYSWPRGTTATSGNTPAVCGSSEPTPSTVFRHGSWPSSDPTSRPGSASGSPTMDSYTAWRCTRKVTSWITTTTTSTSRSASDHLSECQNVAGLVWSCEETTIYYRLSDLREVIAWLLCYRWFSVAAECSCASC